MKNKHDQAGIPLNGSGVRPCGHAVMVIPYSPQKKGGLIVLPDTVKDRNQMLEDRGIVVQIGTEAWCDEKEPRCAVGDKIYMPYMAGRMIGSDQSFDGKLYRLINDRDVVAVIEKEKESV